MDVSYHEGVPNSQFFADIKPNSIVVIDDLYEEAIETNSIARAFKVDSRHQNFTIALITQVELMLLLNIFNNILLTSLSLNVENGQKQSD